MFRSIYIVKISGRDVKRFIKQLFKKNIFIENIDIRSNYAYLSLSKDNYKKLCNIKTIYEIKVVRLKGIARIIDIIKRYYILLLCSFITYIYLLFLSNIVFSIEVMHSKKEIRDLVMNELKSNGIEKYTFFKSFDGKERIEQIILKNNKNSLEWIEIERSGVRYIVKVEERIIKTKKSNPKQRNLVAKKDGIIMKIESSKGEIKKKINDYVKKGDVIVSGLITKNDEVKSVVSATGEVYAEVWYKTTVDMPFYYSERTPTGKSKTTLGLNFMNNKFYFFNFKKYKAHKDNNIFVLDNNLLPIRLVLAKEEEMLVYEKVYSYEEAIDAAKKISDDKMKKRLLDNETIISSKVINTKQYENFATITLFYKIYENITDYKEINNKDIVLSSKKG